jgi:hypothetical protein
MNTGYQKAIKGFGMQKVPRKGYLKQQCLLYKGAHRNRFNDTIIHKVSLKTISLSHLLLKGFFLSYFPQDLSLYLGYLYSCLGGTPHILKLVNSHGVLGWCDA